jgi:hypothetical protein
MVGCDLVRLIPLLYRMEEIVYREVECSGRADVT